MKEHMKKHFSAYVVLTNGLIAVGVAGLAGLGVLSGTLTLPVLSANVGIFGFVYAMGKFWNDQLEDMPRIEAFEKGSEGVVCYRI